VTVDDDAALGRALLESSEDAIISTDRAGIIQSWNDAAERLYGYPAAAMLGQSILAIVPRARIEEERGIDLRIQDGEQIQDFSTVRTRHDGEHVAVTLTISPIRTPAGVITGALRIHRHFSSRALAERGARRLAAIIESSDDAIISKDVNGIITSWNAGAERLFGYAAEEMIGESIRKIIPHDRQTEEDEVLGRIRLGERVDHFETMRLRKDGRLVAISLTVSPIRDSTGRVVGASKIARDISERLRLQAAAQEQAAIAETLGQVGAVVASTLDLDTAVTKIIDAATELTHAEFGAFFYNANDAESGETFSRYALSGASKEAFADFPHPRATALFGATFRGEGVVRLADVIRDPRYGQNPPHYGPPAGHLAVRSYLAVPVKAPSGAVLGGLFFGHSRVGVFTEQHERLALGVAAWASVAVRNAHLYVEARDANRIKDEFLAVLSHELRTPLNAIVGYARLLRGRIISGEKAERGLETLERNATSLTQIVEDVLDVSRIVAGKIRLDMQPVELPLVIHNAVATVQPAADAKGVRLQTIIDPRSGPVSGDPDRLQQVVWNLLSNAVKFTPKQGRVQIHLDRRDSQIEIVVSDTGLGIRPEFLPHVFERFRQAEGGTTRKAGGLGLGLAIVRHIVEMHGGAVHASSGGEGTGATFRVVLPLMVVQPGPLAELNDAAPADGLEPLTTLADLRGTRVLAVDDEQDALILLRVALEAAGAEVTTLASGLGALERIAEVRPDALVIDLGMPHIDGFELISQIRASPNPEVRNVPAAALTAFARSEDRTRALRSGFELHLAKPVDPGELVASVAALIWRARTAMPQH
jgi:PAS domain S-box-containing protein